MKKRHLFITGLPSVGKTTAVLRIAESLSRPYDGFFSQNIYHDKIKEGIRLSSMNGKTLEILRGSNEKGAYSNYVFDVQAFDRFCSEVFDRDEQDRLILIDELGPLLCGSRWLIEKINAWLCHRQILGTIARRGHPLIESVHRRSDTDVVTMTAQNRDELVAYGIAHFS